MKTFYFFTLVILVFACNPVGSDEEVAPNQQNTTGGDDEEPIIQGTLLVPSDDSETLMMLLDSESSKVLKYTMTDHAGHFCFKAPAQIDLALRFVNSNGQFVTSEPFRVESLPLLVEV